MVADNQSPRVVAESPSETMSARICSAHSPQSIEKTVSSSPKTGTHRRGRRRRSARMLAVFLLVVSIVVVHIIKCSRRTRSYTAIYRKEEWVPVVSFNGSRSQHKISSLEHARVIAIGNATFAGSEAVVRVDTKEMLPHPQVLFYSGKSFKTTKGRRIRSRYDLGSLRKKRPKQRPSWSLPTNTTFCVPMKPWQTTSFPTCNCMHEIDLSNEHEEQASLLGTGGWRATWRVDNSGGETVAYKTLKWKDQSFDKTTENRHRIDAVATERLTSSKHVIDIYGYCGQSVINEFAEEGSLLGYVKKHKAPRDKLKMARDVALGVADLHNFDGEGNATIVHRDLKPANIVILRGELKLNDFNDAEFLKWHIVEKRQCRFRRKRWTPTYHSPEEVWEVLLWEKVDVFALGAVIFFIMTGHHPYNSEGISRTEKFKAVAKGIKPKLPRKVKRSKDPAIVALRKAFEACQTFLPNKRPSARDVANELSAVLDSLTLQK